MKTLDEVEVLKKFSNLGWDQLTILQGVESDWKWSFRFTREMVGQKK